MRRNKAATVIVSLVIFLPSTPPSAAVENGLSALGDPNAIAVNLGASAFLYAVLDNYIFHH